MILTTIVALTATLTGSTCTGIDNRTDTAVWAYTTRHGVTYGRTHYTDNGTLVYDTPVPARVRPSLRRAERYLNSTPPGPKVRVQCDGTGTRR